MAYPTEKAWLSNRKMVQYLLPQKSNNNCKNLKGLHKQFIHLVKIKSGGIRYSAGKSSLELLVVTLCDGNNYLS